MGGARRVHPDGNSEVGKPIAMFAKKHCQKKDVSLFLTALDGH